MIDVFVAWLLPHPLEGVGVLCLISIVVGLVLVPSIHEHTKHGHPRC